MSAQIISLTEWKAAHPPVMQCFNVAIRCWWNWATLPWWLVSQLPKAPR